MIKKILILLLLASTALGQNWNNPGQKPWLGQQVDRSHPCAKGLVGCWPMNEGAGNTVADLSGNGNKGEEQGDAVWLPGKFSTCRYFSGDDCIDLGTLPTLTGQDRTIIVWAAADDWSDVVNNCILNFESWGVNCFTYTTGGLDYIAWRTNSDDKRLMSMAGISDGTFHQLVCIVNSIDTIRTLYLDGISMTLGAAVGYAVLSDNYIGTRNLSDWFKGKVCNVLCYNRALSATEIALLYREPFCFMADDLPVSMMYDYSGAAPSGQVIFIQFSAIPILFITTFLLIRKRRRYVE